MAIVFFLGYVLFRFIKSINEKLDDINYLYRLVSVFLLMIFILILFTMSISFFKKDFETIIKLLVPLGVILSASIASLSVLKSIDNTNIIEKEKKEKKEQELNNRIAFYLTLINSIHNVIKNDFILEDTASNQMISNEIKTINELIIRDSELISILNNIDSANLVITLSSLCNIYIQKPKNIDETNDDEIINEKIFINSLIKNKNNKSDKLKIYIDNLNNFINDKR